MSLTKYADFQVLEAVKPERNSLTGRALLRTAHRVVFEYDPRPGMIYVRSRAISSRCNDNYDEFPAEEIKMAYRTFIGKPVFVNHKNSDTRRARGFIIDAALHEDVNPDGSPDTWAEVLMEVDAVRFPVLAREVLKGNIARTSMGTDVAYSECTACGNKADTPLSYCRHIPAMKGMSMRTASGNQIVIAERCYGLGFFENSLLVEDPADPTALVLGVESHDSKFSSMRSTAEMIKVEADQVVQVAEQITRTAARADHYLREAGRCPECNPSVTGAAAGDLCPGHTDVALHVGIDSTASLLAASRLAVAMASMDRTAYGEVKAPAQVDTMRAENCPVCGDDEAYNGDKCSVCGFAQPPSNFADPDLDKAKQVDLRQDQNPGADMDANGNVAQEDVLGNGAAPPNSNPGEDLKCTSCGEVFTPDAGNPATGKPNDDLAAQSPTGDPTNPAADPNSAQTDPDGAVADALADPDDLSDDEIFTEDPTDPTQQRQPKDEVVAPGAGTGEGVVTPDEAKAQDPKDPTTDPTDPKPNLDPKNPTGDPKAEDPTSVAPKPEDASNTPSDLDVEPDGTTPIDPADPREIDPMADQNATGENTDAVVAPNMTCPVCGIGTLIVLSDQMAAEPEVNEPEPENVQNGL